MNSLTLKVPVKTYLKKFLQYHENLTEGQVFQLKGYSPISIMMHTLFTNKSTLRDDDRYRLKKNYPSRIHVEIPAGKISRNQLFLSDHRVVHFNTYLRSMFYDTLLTEIRIQTANGLKEKKVILLFLAKLDILDDIEFDTVLKAIHRLRARKNREKLKTKQNPEYFLKKMLKKTDFSLESVRQKRAPIFA